MFLKHGSFLINQPSSWFYVLDTVHICAELALHVYVNLLSKTTCVQLRNIRELSSIPFSFSEYQWCAGVPLVSDYQCASSDP